jgi:hypothetical protein
MPIMEEYAESIASTTSTLISLPQSYKSVVNLNYEPYTRWLQSPFTRHADLEAYFMKPVRTLTKADHTRISRFMDIVLQANTEDEIYVVIHATPYMSYLLVDMSSRLQRAYQQGYTQREMRHIRQKLQDMVTSIKMMDQLMTIKCQAAGIPWHNWWDSQGDTVRKLLMELPIPTGPQLPRFQPDQKPLEESPYVQQPLGRPHGVHNDTPFPQTIQGTAINQTPSGQQQHVTTPLTGGSGNIDLDQQRPFHPGMTFHTPTRTSTVRLNPELLRPLTQSIRPVTEFGEQLRLHREDLERQARFANENGPESPLDPSRNMDAPQNIQQTLSGQQDVFRPAQNIRPAGQEEERRHTAFASAVDQVVQDHYSRAPPQSYTGAVPRTRSGALPTNETNGGAAGVTFGGATALSGIDSVRQGARSIARVSPVQGSLPTAGQRTQELGATARTASRAPTPTETTAQETTVHRTIPRSELTREGQYRTYEETQDAGSAQGTYIVRPQERRQEDHQVRVQQLEVPPPAQEYERQELYQAPVRRNLEDYVTPAGRPEQAQHVRFDREERRRHRRDSTSSEEDLDNPNLPITERIPGHDYYDTLPAPWNVRPVPRSRHDRQQSVDKADALKRLKLTGSTGSYLSWRPTFISYVHTRPVRLFEKCQAMLNSLDEKEPQLEPVIKILRQRQGDAYRRAILELENRFGGIDRVRDHYLDQLDGHPSVKTEDFYSLDIFITFLNSINDAFVEHGLDYELRSGKFIRTVKDKIPASYLDRYQEWMSINHPGRRDLLFSLPTLTTWMQAKRERIEQNQKDSQAKNKTKIQPKKQRFPASFSL